MLGRDVQPTIDEDYLMSDVEPSEPALVGSGAPTDLNNAMTYINRELSISGYPSPLVFIGADETQAADCVNALFMLLQQRQNDAAYRSELEARYRRLENDYQAVVNTLNRQKERVAQSERETRASIAKSSKLDIEVKTLSDKLKNVTDELKTTKANAKQAMAQFMHEKRKWERELTQLKQKTTKLANDRMKESKINFTVANVTSMKRSASGTLKPASSGASKDEYYAQILTSAEARERDLLQETESLKRTLYDTWRNLQHMYSTVMENSEDDLAVIDLPFELVKETCAQRLREAVQAVRDAWDIHTGNAGLHDELRERDQIIETQNAEMQQHDAAVESLAGQLSSLSSEMNIYAQLVGKWMANQDEASIPDMSRLAPTQQEHTHVQAEQARIARERQQLELERERFTKTALDLGKSRQQLEQERVMVETQKAKAAAERISVSSMEEFLRQLPSGGDSTSSTPALRPRTIPEKDENVPICDVDMDTSSVLPSIVAATPITDKTMVTSSSDPSPYFGNISRIPPAEEGTQLWATPPSAVTSSTSILKSALRGGGSSRISTAATAANAAAYERARQVKISPQTTTYSTTGNAVQERLFGASSVSSNASGSTITTTAGSAPNISASANNPSFTNAEWRLPRVDTSR